MLVGELAVSRVQQQQVSGMLTIRPCVYVLIEPISGLNRADIVAVAVADAVAVGDDVAIHVDFDNAVNADIPMTCGEDMDHVSPSFGIE